jgi:hypothetical protein
MTNIKSFWLVLQSFLELLLFTFSLVSRLGFVLLLFWRAGCCCELLAISEVGRNF